MKIRQAQEKDIPEVKKIIDSLQVTRKQPNWKEKETGFFEYNKTEQELTSLLNPYFLVAEEKEILGFALGWKNKLFHKPTGENKLYLDMLAVKKPGSKEFEGIAAKLFDKFLNLAKEEKIKKITCHVPKKPWENKKSTKFIEKRKFKKIKEINTENNIILGEHQLIL